MDQRPSLHPCRFPLTAAALPLWASCPFSAGHWPHPSRPLPGPGPHCTSARGSAWALPVGVGVRTPPQRLGPCVAARTWPRDPGLTLVSSFCLHSASGAFSVRLFLGPWSSGRGHVWEGAWPECLKKETAHSDCLALLAAF